MKSYENGAVSQGGVMTRSTTVSRLKISVVVPLYNKANFVVEALESVLSQSFPAHEIIVVDDGSTDDSLARVKSLAHRSVHLIQQPNAGVAYARNTGIRAATGDIIAFLDADDRYMPGFLAAIEKLTHDYPKASVFGTGFRRFTHVTPSTVTPLSTVTQLRRGIVDKFYSHWCKSTFICASSIAVRTAALRGADIFFPVGERLGEDQDVWFRLAERYTVAFEPTVLSEYRVDVVGSATRSTSATELLPCYQRLAARLAQGSVPTVLVPGARRLLASHYLNVARSRLVSGDTNGATHLVLHPLARANTFYFLRTAALLGINRLGLAGTK